MTNDETLDEAIERDSYNSNQRTACCRNTEFDCPLHRADMAFMKLAQEVSVKQDQANYSHAKTNAAFEGR